VLGGHQAGANDLAHAVANAIGAVPVITTASDVLGLPAIDLIGRRLGWKIEDASPLSRVAAAVVRGEAIAVYQTAGDPNWWQEFGDWPPHFHRLESWSDGPWSAALAITDRVLPPLTCPTITYRPPTLAFGIGCKRGVPCAEIEALFEEVCHAHKLAPLSLAVVASATLKADEPGLIAFAARHGVPFRTYSGAELARAEPFPTPSERVRTLVGVPGVAEPAALLASGARELLVPKQRGLRVTMAVARKAQP
jgi:cobalt-precorrin 5A hydrolase